jgi:hypothetical protein
MILTRKLDTGACHRNVSAKKNTTSSEVVFDCTLERTNI